MLAKEKNGNDHAFCPFFQGCHSQGDTFEEAIANITEIVKLYIEILLSRVC
ncbi:type II toxin-antitoxin system HicB family antitoxin [Aphanizomenon flos-aquae]|uniref:Type II toxin-antitoxin system HicB family antitoxin n=1 Tax=Aphanizomenon flos-aquae FACHB-1040 TaxID=2692887 RepID=A0ABR8C2I0_APHFL|nr:type II toxin-antitoxin system HicB family antitoxin [Aphanizomenon flos-aquae FACHB-1040]